MQGGIQISLIKSGKCMKKITVRLTYEEARLIRNLLGEKVHKHAYRRQFFRDAFNITNERRDKENALCHEISKKIFCDMWQIGGDLEIEFESMAEDYPDEEEKRIAYHEAGHKIAASESGRIFLRENGVTVGDSTCQQERIVCLAGGYAEFVFYGDIYSPDRLQFIHEFRYRPTDEEKNLTHKFVLEHRDQIKAEVDN